ncbi:LysR family transcriptional regulator [Psychrosphaera sp. B3R10]|uniref:LysR family transcriptional regulator n=1 Tax=Psychrosphaera algicola TaxID=3023714 RepID=A0ABT5F848_9GAMM|nr:MULTISPECIES: LysR family transcriptional regulator [unclassified Psychrosphaera]MBU2880535.1 LysR family transcriptional regulator [Psychrosphaera sp. I2R16]MBU2989144.1 LysR family transcriptional regulator [Psychrosphaera sp. B3R10]MDC2887718.1 LysR family transcriptional regulator [Psychrosphaera sp. G1-22]MDO6717801.1 LysR family transcriptional regulator [Psychrosphaera sp. 1_MG-2023]
MNIEHLKLFVRIAATHNISLAGNELGLSPAVASSHMNKLEASLGVKLIYRTTRKVSLTEEGLAFLPHAEGVLDTVDTARAAVGAGSYTPQGTIRVAAPASFGRMHIIPALKGFIDQYPELKIDLRLSDSMIDMVEGGFDIAIRNASLNDSTLIARKLSPDRRVVCASPDYIKQYGEPLHPSELQHHQCITLFGLDNWQFETPEGVVRVKAKGMLRTDNGESIRDASVEGIGVTLCSMWCGYREFENGKLVQILKEFPLVSDTAIWAVYPSSRLVAPKVRAFIDYFSQYFGNTPYWEKSSH